MKGGKREGAGRKPAPSTLKKRAISLKLPGWLLERMTTLPGNRAVEIEAALCAQHGWKPPDTDWPAVHHWG